MSPRNKNLFAAAFKAMLVLAPGGIFAHGTVGHYTFIEPLLATDAILQKTEADLLKRQWIFNSDGRQFELGSSLQKQLSDNLALEIESAWIQQSYSSGPSRQGFDELTLMPKYSFPVAPQRELIMGAGVVLMFPTGSGAVQFHNHAESGPHVMWAKGFASLPDLGAARILARVRLSERHRVRASRVRRVLPLAFRRQCDSIRTTLLKRKGDKDPAPLSTGSFLSLHRI